MEEWFVALLRGSPPWVQFAFGLGVCGVLPAFTAWLGGRGNMSQARSAERKADADTAMGVWTTVADRLNADIARLQAAMDRVEAEKDALEKKFETAYFEWRELSHDVRNKYGQLNGVMAILKDRLAVLTPEELRPLAIIKVLSDQWTPMLEPRRVPTADQVGVARVGDD